MSLKSKIAIIVIVITIFTAGTLYLLIKYSFEHWLDGNISKHQEIVSSSLGDKFIIEYESRKFPDNETLITIKDADRNEKIEYFVIHGDFQKQGIQNIINTSQLRCYLIFRVLIYKSDTMFEAVSIDDIENIDPHEKPSFTQVAKALFETKNWLWIKPCGEFLIRAGDTEIKKELERYAAGQFSAEELDKNKNSEIKKEDIIDFSKKLLETQGY